MTGFAKQVRALVYERAHGVCEQCGKTQPAMHYHHRRPRGMGGSKASDTNGAANCVLVCDKCHRFIESYRNEFLERGWLVPQGKKPSEQPIWRHQQWVLLDDYGYVTPAEESQLNG